MSAPEVADRKAVGGVHAASAVEGHCSWLLHTAVILLLVLAVGTILPIHHFTGLSLSAKEWGSLTVKNAELNFILTANMSGSLFHAVAGALLMSRSNWLWQQNDGTTKPVLFLGLFLGLLGLLLEWVGESVAIMLLANVLFGAMYGLCGTVLLTTVRPTLDLQLAIAPGQLLLPRRLSTATARGSRPPPLARILPLSKVLGK